MARILLCEDDAGLRNFIRIALEMDGHDVMAAHDGGDAFQLIQSGYYTFDLLLADIDMPVMDGIALALKAARDWPELAIVLMSGYSHQRERAGDLREIVAGIIAKPFTLEDITGRVRAVLAEAA